MTEYLGDCGYGMIIKNMFTTIALIHSTSFNHSST